MLTITPDQVKAEVAAEYCFCAGDAVHAMQMPAAPDLARLTLCIWVLKNGLTIVGQASVADVANFSAELGIKFARDDAMRQAWPVVMSYLQERQ